MGLRQPGGIARHLVEVRDATLAYLEVEQQQAGRDTSLLSGLELAESEPPEQPEPLSVLRQMRRLNLPLWSGGLDDQPWIFTQELHTVIDAELDFQERQALNLKLQEQAKTNAAALPSEA